MKYLLSFAATFLLAAASPAVAKDWLSIRGPFQRAGTNTATTNTMGAWLDMQIGNNKARVTITATNVAAATNHPFLVGGIRKGGLSGNVRRKAVLLFQTPEAKNGARLDFDPRGQALAITSANNSNLLTLTVGASGQPTNISYHETVDLTPAEGVTGQAAVSYDQTHSNLTDFRISLNKASAGTNDVFVDGQYRGSIVVVRGRKATLRFVAPYGINDLPLNFEPRGKVVDVLRAGVLQFTGTFRAGATGVTQCFPTATQASLLSTGLDADASGWVRFVTTAQCVRQFRVSAQNLAAGNYELFVNGTNRATLTVSSNDASGSAQITFSTAPASGESLLSFDAEGQLIQLQQGTSTFFSGTGAPVALTGCAATQTTLPLWNLGLITGAQGSVRLKQTEDCGQAFRVEVSSVPVGAYEFYVGGVLRGVVNVTSSGTATSGSLEFFNPFSPATQYPMLFVPSGQWVEIRQGPTVLLQRLLPGSPIPTPSGLGTY